MKKICNSSFMRSTVLFVVICSLVSGLSGCGSNAPSGGSSVWIGNAKPIQNAMETTLEQAPEKIPDDGAVDASVPASKFAWEVGSGRHITIGQTKEQIDSILGESPEKHFVVDDKNDGMYRAKYEYESAGGFNIEYNRAGEAVLFFAENADITGFLGLHIGDNSTDVFDVLISAYGEEKIEKNSGGYTYVVYFDSSGNAIEWTTNQFQWSYLLSLHCEEALDIMQIYWRDGAYKQVSDCKAEIIGTTWELGYVLDPFGEPYDAGDFFGSGLRYGTSLVFNEDGTFEYWIGLYDGYGTFITDGDRILLTYEGSQNGDNDAGDTGLMLYYSQYTNPYSGDVTRAVSLGYMAWDTASDNNKPYNVFFVDAE